MKQIYPSPSKSNRSHGFALVVTLTLMVLLSILAIGLLSLSSVSLRSANVGSARQSAQANARLALMLALGELQTQAGPDTRITARADILDEKNPPVLGVWKSWEGTDHELSGSGLGRPVSPGNYKTEKENRFLAWMVSGDGTALPDTSAGNGKATLVGTGSVGSGSEKTEVHLPFVPVNKPGNNGAYAWWVGGENLKARIPEPHEPPTGTPGQWATRMKSHGTADPEPYGLDTLLTNPDLGKKAVTRDQIDLITTAAPPISEEYFHDLSVSSSGLLTNAATGGWKKDFSLFTEKAATPGASDLPLFRLKPDQDIFTTLASTGDVRGSNSVFYPWSVYRGNSDSPPIYQHGAVASWNNLIDYALLYKKTDSAGKSMSTVSTDIYGNKHDFLHRVRILPLIARIQWVYSHSAGPPAPNTNPAPPAGSLEPRLLLTPVVTMWNPYNVQLTSDPLVFTVPKPLPASLKFTVNGYGGDQYPQFQSTTTGSSNYSRSLSNAGALRYRIPSQFQLLPGETRIFSPTDPPVNGEGAPELKLEPGYRSKSGHYFALKNNIGAKINAPPSATIKAVAAFDTTYYDNATGVGIYLDMFINNTIRLAYRMVYKPEVARAIYKLESDLADSPSLSNLSTNPSPFMTTVFGARMASRTHIPAKGFVQSSPLVNYTAMGGKDEVEFGIYRHYRGSGHPVNSPFDYSFKAITANDSNAPGEDASTNRGYIVTGFNKADGLSRCVIAELPTRPIQSIAELQNWDLRYENPIPPFAFNLIGNSDATPLIAVDEVTGDYSDDVNLQHDDSYCANHLLFDDWFCSSIAPDPANFGSSGRDLKTVFSGHIDGTSRLPNHAYLPIQADSGGDADELFAKHVNTTEAWKNIASRLEVQGMFNVNSTSVTAWRAILGHARNQKIPFITEAGGSFNVSLSGETDHAASRFSVAGDSDTSSSGTSGAFPGASEFTGYRILDETIIDALAEEIVNQVRLRGPFLSLSEFVNRQLSSGNLALSGALQSALDEIAKTSSTNPYKGITAVLTRPAGTVPPGGGPADAEYRFPAAAVGESTYGLPGWTRQADILRPLAPILSVRDDTFTIRAYGDARDNDNNILATAVCEATVRRTRDYLDPVDSADLATYPTSVQNRIFGRRFQVTSFRWLAPHEI